jgi:hypothetical protein
MPLLAYPSALLFDSAVIGRNTRLACAARNCLQPDGNAIREQRVERILDSAPFSQATSTSFALCGILAEARQTRGPAVDRAKIDARGAQ